MMKQEKERDMLAAVVKKPGELVIEEIERPKPGQIGRAHV